MTTVNTPKPATSPLADNLPRWGYVLIAFICAAMGVWASYVTLEYFKHGAMALESDKSLQELATFAALMFVASEMGAFLIAAMMTERDLRVRRWALTLFAFAVLSLEVCTIVAVQLALTTGADNHQLDVRQAEIDLRSRIAAIESDAAITRDTGATQSMAARSIKDAASRAWAMQQAAKTVGKASSNNAALNDLHNKLAGVMANKKPTLVGVLGKEYATYYAIARGILISLGGLVFFGTAGALIRMARNAAAGKTVADHSQMTTPATQDHSQMTIPAPSFSRAGIAPKGVSNEWQPWARNATVAGGLAGLAGMAHALPTIAPAPQEHSQMTTPDHSHLTTPSKPKKARAKAAGEQMDTGTTGIAATRYNRIKQGVINRKTRPSINALVNLTGEQIGDKRAREYLDAMVRDGVLVKNEATNRWEYAPTPEGGL